MKQLSTRGVAPLIIIIGVILILLLFGLFTSNTSSWKFSPPSTSPSNN